MPHELLRTGLWALNLASACAKAGSDEEVRLMKKAQDEAKRGH